MKNEKLLIGFILSTEQIFLLARENLRPPKRFKTPPLGAEHRQRRWGPGLALGF